MFIAAKKKKKKETSKLEKIQMSFRKRMVKQAVVHPCHGILVSNKKWQNDIDSKMDETQNMLNERRHTGPCII